MRNTTKLIRTNEDSQHFHRWRIEEPDGPVSGGVCRDCGETKQFKNWLSDGDFITNEEHRMSRAA